jgi:hypothetical protein
LATRPVDGEYDCAIVTNINGCPAIVAECFGRVSELARLDAVANAAFIVRAVNSHDALVAALDFAADTLNSVIPDIDAVAEIRNPGPIAGPAYRKLDAARMAVSEARAALSTLKG